MVKKFRSLIYIFLFYLLNTYFINCSYANETLVRIYFIPFETLTYTPVTKLDMEKTPFKYGEVKADSEEMIELKTSLAENKSCSFDGKMVRAKIIFPDSSTYYIDQDGGMILPDSSEARLTIHAFKNIEKILEKNTQDVTHKWPPRKD